VVRLSAELGFDFEPASLVTWLVTLMEASGHGK